MAEGFTIVHASELERAGPKWALVRRSLGVRSFGINLVELQPGETIPEHDETERNQEELFAVLGGSPTIVIDGEEHPAPAGTYARLDPGPKRRIVNNGPGAASVLIVSAPTTSGYEPMEWA
jgi:uncharacterized cupin superfamily protein